MSRVPQQCRALVSRSSDGRVRWQCPGQTVAWSSIGMVRCCVLLIRWPTTHSTDTTLIDYNKPSDQWLDVITYQPTSKCLYSRLKR
jgi:hypothetical protein